MTYNSKNYKTYYRRNRAKCVNRATQWAKDNPEKHRARIFKLRRGITYAERDQLLASQGGKCALCRGLPTMKKRIGWHVDHIHGTKFIRGVLCHRCNLALGLFRDDPKELRRAAMYLEKANNRLQNAAILGDTK